MKYVVNKNSELKDMLLSLSDKAGKLTQGVMGVKKLWYWEYYDTVAQDIADAKLRRKIYQQIYHLERFGYFEKAGLSAKALERLRKLKDKDAVAYVKWDKKWRIVIFDIPEKRRNTRDMFRQSLKQLGFKLLQGSIWVNPFGNLEDIQEIIKEQKIEKFVVFIAADKISNDLLFKQKFGLL